LDFPTKLDKKTAHNSVGLINCLRQPGQPHNQLPKSKVLNLFQLIKSCGTETYPAAETKSVGLPADALLPWFLQSHLDSFTVPRDSQPLTGIRPSIRILPSGQLCMDQKAFIRQPGFVPSGQLCLDNETFSHLPGLFIWTKKLSSIYRDYAKTHASPMRTATN
jgi:hypothetical protein